ncbi:type VII secretion protein EssA [Metabacillus arenae]|uniref:Type VII secretion protein EssA n=1 Tax=Metabacillus arenae TaxID=2771434 RepID=A0A926NAF2_9BACI|nr:type VII secretion protein EssA [Metabacillus arenae]MBD1379769.1 type VII secretion protein EssA [Metabacillus arenae]
MKFNWILKGVVLLFPLSFFLSSPSAIATPNLNGLEPYIYEGKNTKRGTDYLREKSKYEKPEDIPEEQQDLTFEKTKQNDDEEIQNQLFSNYTRENNTITAKAEQMELFSPSMDQSASSLISQEPVQKSSTLFYIFGFLIGISVLTVFGFIIWHYKKQQPD